MTAPVHAAGCLGSCDVAHVYRRQDDGAWRCRCCGAVAPELPASEPAPAPRRPVPAADVEVEHIRRLLSDRTREER